MLPLRQAAAKARRLAKTHPTDEHRAMYCSARNRYLQVIEREKTNSWRRYLSTLTVDTLFQAKKYAAGPRPSPLIPTLFNAEGVMCISNKDKAKALFGATCIATSNCDLSDTTPAPFPRIPLPNATYLSPPSLFFSKSSILDALRDTHPMKAPGPDCIQTWAWDVIHNHLVVLFQRHYHPGIYPSKLEDRQDSHAG